MSLNQLKCAGFNKFLNQSKRIKNDPHIQDENNEQLNRCCQSLLIKHRFYDEDPSHLRVHSNSLSLSASEMTKMMESLLIRCDSTLYGQIRDISLSEQQLFVFMDLTWENIRQ